MKPIGLAPQCVKGYNFARNERHRLIAIGINIEEGTMVGVKTGIGSAVKRGTVLAILLVAIGLVAVFLILQEGSKESRILHEGDKAEEFRLPTTDGRMISLSDYRGTVVMVHFWATWCPPCVEEIPTLDRLARMFSSKDLELLAVSVDEGGAAAVNAFMRRNSLSLPVLLDPRRTVARRYGTFKYPETYIVDGRGIVRYKAIGARDWTAPENINILRDIIDKK
jgi:peroxiredoxin